MAYSKKTKTKAFKLFCEGVPIEQIGKQLEGSPSKNTIWKWHNQGNWKERLAKIDRRADEKVGEGLAEIKSRQRRLIKNFYAEYLKAAKAGNAPPVLPKDIINAMRHELLLAGEETERVGVNLLEMVNEVISEKRKRKKGGDKDGKKPKESSPDA